MRYLNMYDSLSCINCLSCMSACSVENRMRMERDAGVYISRGVNQFLHASYYLRPEKIAVSKYPDSRLLVGFQHCRHCEIAACLDNCPSTAIERRPTGQVVINESACIGCRTCRDVCPFDVPFYDEQSGKAKKCIGCYDRVESGLEPACVSACMTQALFSGPPEEVIAEGEQRAAQYSERLGREYFLYGKDRVNYVRLGHARIGKFNVGQKLFAWTMIAAIIAITASGFVLMFRGLFSQGTQEFSRFAHAASFVVIGVFLIVHLYLSLLPMNRQSLKAMFEDGRLPVDYVKSHHPIWYEKLTGEKRPEATPAEKGE